MGVLDDLISEVLSGACLEQSEPDAENPCPEVDSENRNVFDRAAPDIAPDKQILSGAVNFQADAHYNRAAPDKQILSGAVHWTETYSPAKRPEDKYYRYMWMQGRYLRHRHIRGGNIEAKLAKERLAMVEDEIAHNKSPREIVELIKKWGSGETGSEPMRPPMSRTQLAWALGDFEPADLAWAIGSAALSDEQLQSISKTAMHRLAERHQ